MIKHSEVKNRIWQEIEHYNNEYGKTEQLKAIELLPKEWSVDSNEMTPTLKLKRKIILSNNEELVNKIYAHENDE